MKVGLGNFLKSTDVENMWEEEEELLKERQYQGRSRSQRKGKVAEVKLQIKVSRNARREWRLCHSQISVLTTHHVPGR